MDFSHDNDCRRHRLTTLGTAAGIGTFSNMDNRPVSWQARCILQPVYINSAVAVAFLMLWHIRTSLCWASYLISQSQHDATRSRSSSSACSYRSLSGTRSIDRTDRRTDTRPLHKPCLLCGQRCIKWSYSELRRNSRVGIFNVLLICDSAAPADCCYLQWRDRCSFRFRPPSRSSSQRHHGKYCNHLHPFASDRLLCYTTNPGLLWSIIAFLVFKAKHPQKQDIKQNLSENLKLYTRLSNIVWGIWVRNANEQTRKVRHMTGWRNVWHRQQKVLFVQTMWFSVLN